MKLGHLRKYASVVLQPAYHRGLRHGVVAGVEHEGAIRFVKPATLIDVGANKGQFSAVVRRLFPRAVVHAFEPLASERTKLAAVVPGATIHPYAVSEQKGPVTFYVTDRADSSSLFTPGTAENNAFGVAVTEQIKVEAVHIQDHVDLAALPRPVMMKIDVQGAELSVLRSLEDAIGLIDSIYCEISFIPLYEGQSLATEVCAYLFERGFALRGAYNPSHVDRLGPAQADLLFERQSQA